MTSQLTVLMFADIVGYSAIMEQDQAEAVAIVRSLRSQFLEPVAVEHGGSVLKRLGDGWIIAFGGVSACVDCAQAVQERLAERPDVKLRIGCHIGEILEEEDDFYGSGLNIAQRIQSEAPPGGLMVSEDLYRQLPRQRAAALRDAGIFRLKNIAQPVRLYQWRPVQQRDAGAGDISSIAVAAIEFAPQDADTAALAGDLRDQLVIRMSRRQGIAILDAAGSHVPNATYDLRSRLRVAGGRGRLSLTLVLRSEGRPVWSENYEGETDDIFEFCDVLLEQAEGDLRLQTNAFDGDRLSRIADEDLSVSELRARAANCFYRVTYDDWSHGLNLMNRAVHLNPHDGVALAMRAEAEIMLSAARYEALPRDTVNRLGRDLDIAVEQSPGSDYVFWARGTFRINCLDDVPGARADLSRSRELNPAYLEDHELEGHILMFEGAFADAAECFAKLLLRQTHNPLMPYRCFLRSVAHYVDGRFDLAVQDARRAADMRPNERGLHAMLGLAQEALGDTDAARRSLGRAAALPAQPHITSRCPVLPPGRRDLAERLAAAIRNPAG